MFIKIFFKIFLETLFETFVLHYQNLLKSFLITFFESSFKFIFNFYYYKFYDACSKHNLFKIKVFRKMKRDYENIFLRYNLRFLLFAKDFSNFLYYNSRCSNYEIYRIILQKAFIIARAFIYLFDNNEKM